MKDAFVEVSPGVKVRRASVTRWRGRPPRQVTLYMDGTAYTYDIDYSDKGVTLWSLDDYDGHPGVPANATSWDDVRRRPAWGGGRFLKGAILAARLLAEECGLRVK